MCAIRVAVVDDHPLLREGVAHTLHVIPDIEVVATGGSASDAIAIASSHVPNVMLVDISMPGGGVEAVREISKATPAVRTLMLTVSEREDDIITSMDAGARGYLLKGVSGRDLVATVRAIYNGETYIPPHIAARVLARMQNRSVVNARLDATASLTARENQILRQVAQGLTNKEIANCYSLSEKTVKHYMTSVLQKLNVRNRVEAVIASQKLLAKSDRQDPN